MEIERKYLVASLPDNLEAYPHVEIEQGYLCTSPTLRIRRAGDVYWLTVKENVRVMDSSPCQGEVPEGRRGVAAIHNREEEFRLTADRYAHLRAKCDGNLVHKTRYKIPLDGGLTAELDIFHGAHQGLRLVEVEFPDTASADAFVPPAWFGLDVSQDPRYRNSWLSMNNNIPTI